MYSDPHEEIKEPTRISALEHEQTFAGKTVIVTGASSGIGRAVSKRLILRGAKVILIARNRAKLEDLVNECRGMHMIEPLILPMDLGNPILLEKNFRTILAKTEGVIHSLINAAGVVTHKSLRTATLKDWDRVMNLNVRVIFQLISICIPFLKKSKGTIVNVSSTAGTNPEPGALCFSVSKAIINMLTKCAALELANFGIRVNAVAPGFTKTAARISKDGMELTPQENNTLINRIAKSTPLQQKVNEAEDVADAIIWLASEDASFVTGEIMTIDGGQSLTSNLFSEWQKETETQNIGKTIKKTIFGP